VKVVYVAGPFRGPSSWDIEQNIRRAEELALEAWRSGAAVICPHTNTRFFQGAADDAVWLDGDLEILKRCDAVLTTADWTRSSGARAEVTLAKARDLPVFHDVAALRHWLTANGSNVSLRNPQAHAAHQGSDRGRQRCC
jgi:nucleoside 2-deoxyribosyltransferase